MSRCFSLSDATARSRTPIRKTNATRARLSDLGIVGHGAQGFLDLLRLRDWLEAHTIGNPLVLAGDLALAGDLRINGTPSFVTPREIIRGLVGPEVLNKALADAGGK
jgi:hypothetical protein